MRRTHDRRRVHYGRRSPESVSEATAIGANGSAPVGNGRRAAAQTAVLEAPAPIATAAPDEIAVPEQRWDDGVAEHLPGRIVREKEHTSEPMSVDQALYEMELVGHDFYLYFDSDAGKPSVVYRRKGFDYGVIRLV